jgi:hypothetical protein
MQILQSAQKKEELEEVLLILRNDYHSRIALCHHYLEEGEAMVVLVVLPLLLLLLCAHLQVRSQKEMEKEVLVLIKLIVRLNLLLL